MRKIFLFTFVLISGLASAQQLEKIWETDTIIAIPESVLPVPKQNIMYVSLIDGPGWAADGKGRRRKDEPRWQAMEWQLDHRPERSERTCHPRQPPVS